MGSSDYFTSFYNDVIKFNVFKGKSEGERSRYKYSCIACVTKQYIDSIKIAKLSSPGKVNTRYVSGKDNGHIWLLRKDKVSKNSYIFHDLSVIFSIGLTV